MSIADRVHAARAFDAARFVPFTVDRVVVGQVRRDLAERLRDFPRVFTLGESSCGFCAGLDGADARTRAMAEVAAALAAQGLLSAWRNETYDITAGADGACLFRLERAAVRFFGFLARAVHVNGLVHHANGQKAMWIARRSRDKAIDPGMLDNLVGGGLASGLSIAQTLVKESWEEAGIAPERSRTARPAGMLRIRRAVPEGLHAEIIYVHDLTLPADFVPRNQDGEVADLQLWPFEAVREGLDGDAPFTVDAALVALDCLVRHGAVEAGPHAAPRDAPDQ